MPLRVFGKCKTTTPATSFKHQILGEVLNGTPFVDFGITEWQSPDINWTPPGIVYNVSMQIGFNPSSSKSWFFAGHEFTDTGHLPADDGQFDGLLPAIFTAAGDLRQTGSPLIGITGIQADAGSYGFQSAPFIGDPPTFLCQPFVNISPADSLSIPPLKIESSISGSPPLDPQFWYARAFNRSELIEGTFNGTDYLLTGKIERHWRTNPCGSQYELPLIFRSVVYRDTAFVATYGATIDFRSTLLIEVASDPNYD